MTDTPTFAVRPSFLGIAKSDPAAAICVAGIPYDLGTSNRPGARFGPTAIRPPSRLPLGGDHTVTLALLRALASRTGPGQQPLALVHFDAHVDTWPDSFGQRFGHGSAFYHAIEEKLVDPHRAVQVGIRSAVDKDVHTWTREKGVSILFP